MKNAYRLLVIDNDQFTNNQLRNYFSSHAVMNVVKTIEDGKEGLDYIINNQSSFDCLIIDLLLPSIDGLTIIQKMKERGIDKKIVILSAFKDANVFKSLSKLNVDYYVCRYDESDKGCYQKDKDCSIGKDESTCKSIILYEKYEEGVKKNTKCVWEDKGCVEKPKECEDAKNAKECSTIDLTLSGKNDKKCIYLYTHKKFISENNENI